MHIFNMAAFCASCGGMLLKSYSFCPKCGDKCGDKVSESGPSGRGSSKAANKTSSSSSLVHLPNFETFKAQKETERRSFSVRNKSKKARIQHTEVTITIGVMKDRKTVRRGERLPVKVMTSSTAKDILEAGKKKHAAYNKRFRPGEYCLVYRDGSDVDFIPGTKEPFNLLRYREESGFGYARINFFLLPVGSIFDELEEFLEETEPEEENGSDHSSEDPEPVDRLFATSCSGGTSSSSNGNVQSSGTIEKIECPTCYERFSIDEVVMHADICAEAFWGQVDNDDDVGLQCGKEERSSQKDLKSEILQLKKKHLKEKEEPVRVTVRRKKIWEDFKRSRERYFIPDRNLKVTFSGEPAVDVGGPKREFFSEMLNYVATSLFVDGMPSKSTISLNCGDFKLAGEVMAMSIMQHGQAPNFLSPVIFRYLSNSLLVEDITSPTHREFCEKIEGATDEELAGILQEESAFSLLEEVGYRGVPARETKGSIQNVVRSICINDQVGEVLPQLVQLADGLSTCGVLGAVQKLPKLWEAAFVTGAGYNVTASNLMEEIQPEYSSSQLKREKEADSYHYLCDFIHSLEAKSLEELAVPDFLKWLTGSRTYPPLGFPKKIKCQFLHGCPDGCRCRPTTSTCDLVFTLPVHLATEEEMASIMNSALRDCIGFGLL